MAPLTNLQTRAVETLIHPYTNQATIRETGPLVFERGKGVYIYDVDGNLATTTMATYLVPSAAELPSYETDLANTESPTNPLGVKGVGETGTIAAAPAVINAVVDALSHLGVTDIQMPATPERVWRAIQEVKR